MTQNSALTSRRPTLALSAPRKRFEDMNKSELVEALTRNQASLRQLKEKQRSAQSSVATKGEYMETNTYNALIEQINAKTGVVQLIQTALTKLRNSGPSLDLCFMQVARRKLEPSLFEDLVAEANLMRSGSASNLADRGDDDQPPSSFKG